MAERKTSNDTSDEAAQNDGTSPQGPVVDPVPADRPQAPQPVLTQADIALAREQDMNRARLAADDRARAEGPTIRMRCVSPFTLITDDAPRGRVVAVGEELDIPAYDVDAYTGRMQPVDPIAPDQLAGPTVTRTGGPLV